MCQNVLEHNLQEVNDLYLFLFIYYNGVPGPISLSGVWWHPGNIHGLSASKGTFFPVSGPLHVLFPPAWHALP